MECVRAVREAAGPDVDLLIEVHGRLSPANAIRLAHRLEPYDIGFYEEPVPPESWKALKQVKEQVKTRICVGERLHTRFDFVPVFQNRLADYIMPDTVWTGGISEVKKIAVMAEAYDIPIAPHVVPGGPLELIAAAHTMSTVPNFYRLEYAHHLVPVHNEMLTEPYSIENGEMVLNGKPGLGYDLDEGWLAAHAME